MIKRFNIRVYGILINARRQILLSDEIVRATGDKVTKFPGGGLELGEGLKDCLKREFREELNIDIEIIEHIYTTDFFQQSAFNPQEQLISVYYLVGTKDLLNFPQSNTANYPQDNTTENFRWVNLNDFNKDALSLPIDKIAADKLLFYLG